MIALAHMKHHESYEAIINKFKQNESYDVFIGVIAYLGRIHTKDSRQLLLNTFIQEADNDFIDDLGLISSYLLEQILCVVVFMANEAKILKTLSASLRIFCFFTRFPGLIIQFIYLLSCLNPQILSALLFKSLYLGANI